MERVVKLDDWKNLFDGNHIYIYTTDGKKFVFNKVLFSIYNERYVLFYNERYSLHVYCVEKIISTGNNIQIIIDNGRIICLQVLK